MRFAVLLRAVSVPLAIGIVLTAAGGSSHAQAQIAPIPADPCALAEPATGSSCDNPRLNPGPQSPDSGPPAPIPPIPGVDAPPNPPGGDINTGGR